MRQHVSTESVNALVKRLNSALKAYPHYTMRGLINAARLIKRDCELTPPLTPLDTGNLRASFFITSWMLSVGGWDKPIVALGYTTAADYAPYVHERTDPKVQWSRPGSGPKWFEEALRRNMDNVLDKIWQSSGLKRRR